MEIKRIIINILHKKDYYEFSKSDGSFICSCDHSELKETMEEVIKDQKVLGNEYITFSIKKL